MGHAPGKGYQTHSLWSAQTVLDGYWNQNKITTKAENKTQSWVGRKEGGSGWSWTRGEYNQNTLHEIFK